MYLWFVELEVGTMGNGIQNIVVGYQNLHAYISHKYAKSS